jgi:hypothetical protein
MHQRLQMEAMKHQYPESEEKCQVVVFFLGFLFLHTKKGMRLMITGMKWHKLLILEHLPFLCSIEPPVRTVFSMSQLITIWALELATHRFLCFFK